MQTVTFQHAMHVTCTLSTVEGSTLTHTVHHMHSCGPPLLAMIMQGLTLSLAHGPKASKDTKGH